jgi:hypothetical protein
MAANRGMVEASMEAANFCVNSHGGAYEIGKARPRIESYQDVWEHSDAVIEAFPPE